MKKGEAESSSAGQGVSGSMTSGSSTPKIISRGVAVGLTAENPAHEDYGAPWELCLPRIPSYTKVLPNLSLLKAPPCRL